MDVATSAIKKEAIEKKDVNFFEAEEARTMDFEHCYQ